MGTSGKYAQDSGGRTHAHDQLQSPSSRFSDDLDLGM